MWPLPGISSSSVPWSKTLRLLCFLGSSIFTLVVDSDAGPYQAGRWTKSNDPDNHWSAIQVHMALLRGDGTYHSKILAWQEGYNPLIGVLKDWNPQSDSAAACFRYKSGEFMFESLQNPAGNIFCAGLSHLKSGPLLILGGHEAEETGITQATTFDPNAGTQWVLKNAMSARRWYPTSTSLPDGKVLTFSGSEFLRAFFLGGSTNPQALAPDTSSYLHRLNLTTAGTWDARIIPNDQVPTPREGHTLTPDEGLSNYILFGGRDTSQRVKNDGIYLLFSDDKIDSGEVYRWAWKDIQTSPAPAARRLHTAIVRFDSLGVPPNDLIIFGGLDSSSNALSDMWKVWPIPNPPSGSPWDWKRISVDTTFYPGPRYGHGAIYEPKNRMMFMYGGRGTNGAQSDSEVWAFKFDNGTWIKPTLAGSTRPRWREGHAFVGDSPYDRGGPFGLSSERVVLFGGETSSGYANDAWLLWISEDADSVQWDSLVVSPSTPPSGRKRVAATYDFGFDRLLVMGGQTGASTSTNETWGLSLRYWKSGQPDSATWATLASNPNASRSGATAVYDGVAHFARYPEIFDGTNWTKLPNPKRQPWYPFMFVLPSGNVFFAGADDTTHILHLNDYSWSTINQTNTRLPGGSAVMYRPGKIMKCGTAQSGQSVTFTPSQMRRATSKIEFDNSDNTSGWVYSDSLDSARVYHNLTVLPNGTVLCTGGTSRDDMHIADGPVVGPRIWDPNQGTNGTWSGAGVLAPEPVRRNYHSTALLLPDGRILSAGGNAIPEDSVVTIYCPPYLFNSSDQLATRPTIQGAPDTLGYGKTLTVCTELPSGISSACLIKPSAVTHAFNEDQRYVPLTISTDCGVSHLLVTGPANANQAPPGDYLLFILNSAGVPAIAKWIWVGNASSRDLCDAAPPLPISDLTIQDYGQTYVDLSWTDTGDDSLCLPASALDLRYWTSNITEANWDSATKVTTLAPVPGTPGTVHSCITIPGLTKCKTYYFAIKIGDDKPQWSAISNVPSVKTKCSGSGPICNGDGLVAQGGDDKRGWFAQNSILWQSPAGRIADLYCLKEGPSPQSGAYRTRLLKMGSGRADLDEVTLQAVDHDPAVSAFASSNGILLGTATPVRRVLDEAGTDVTQLVSGSADSPYQPGEGKTLIVALGDFESSRTGLVIESAAYMPKIQTDRLGILVQSLNWDGTWRTLDHIHPRRMDSEFAVDAEGHETLRLVCLGDHAIRSLHRLAITGMAMPQALALSRAVHSRLGDVSEAVASSGGDSTTLSSGDELDLSFSPSPVPAGKMRDLFLRVESGSGDVVGEAPTYEFALGVARPNPSLGNVTIAYTLAKESPVSIRVYDVAGRLVRNLVTGTLEAGPHEVVWDISDDRGSRVRAGVYFYRMVAETWRSQRKVVLIDR